MGELIVAKNQCSSIKKFTSNWKNSFKLTASVVMPLLIVLAINIFDFENIIIAKTTPSNESDGKAYENGSDQVISFDANDFIASESKYLAFLSNNDLRKLQDKNYQEAKSRIKFDYSQTENLSPEERQNLEELTWKTASYLVFVLGEPRYSKNVPVEIHFYSQNFLPRADICTKMGGQWEENSSVCLSSKNENPIKIADNWNGSHINRFTYVADENGNRVINSFEGYRINLAIGQNNRKVKNLTDNSTVNNNNENDNCDINGLQKTIAHELTHNFNSIINPSQYDEAIAYYSSIVTQRIMADDSIIDSLERNNVVTKDSSGRWNVNDLKTNGQITVKNTQLKEALDKFNCIRSQMENIKKDSENIITAVSYEKMPTFSDYQLAEKLLGENEKMPKQDIVSCVMKSYKETVSVKNVFIQPFDFPNVIAVCAQGVGNDTINLGLSK